jgi:hypothetical protein
MEVLKGLLGAGEVVVELVELWLAPSKLAAPETVEGCVFTIGCKDNLEDLTGVFDIQLTEQIVEQFHGLDL